MLVLGIGDSSGDNCNFGDISDFGDFLGENCVLDVDDADDDADVGDFFLAQFDTGMGELGCDERDWRLGGRGRGDSGGGKSSNNPMCVFVCERVILCGYVCAHLWTCVHVCLRVYLRVRTSMYVYAYLICVCQTACGEQRLQGEHMVSEGLRLACSHLVWRCDYID
jgi:hypothetical protein